MIVWFYNRRQASTPILSSRDPNEDLPESFPCVSSTDKQKLLFYQFAIEPKAEWGTITLMTELPAD